MASEWTIETLKELFDRTTADRDIRVNLALSAAKEAVTKAEIANERRLDLLNEFRAQQADESRKYAPIMLVDERFTSVDGRVSRIETTVAGLQGRALALAGFGTIVGAFVGALAAKILH